MILFWLSKYSVISVASEYANNNREFEYRVENKPVYADSINFNTIVMYTSILRTR